MHTESYPNRSARADQAYTDLKQQLLLGGFALNVRLGEERLATLLGVSRTPVREALHRLHAEGIVRRLPDGGYEPVAPDVGRMRHLYEVRAGLEMQALQRPGRRAAAHGQLSHDRAALLMLRAEWQDLADDENLEASPAFVLLDEAFHVTLAEAAGNPVIAELLRQVNDRIRIVRMQDFLTLERVRSTIDEHLGLVDAVLAGDLAEAERRFTEHLDRSIAVVEERVLRAIARMVQGGLQGGVAL